MRYCEGGIAIQSANGVEFCALDRSSHSCHAVNRKIEAPKFTDEFREIEVQTRRQGWLERITCGSVKRADIGPIGCKRA